MGRKSLTTLCKSQSIRNRWITIICDLIRPRGKSLGGVTLTAAFCRLPYWIQVEYFKWEGGNVRHVLGLEFDEEHNGEVRFQISLFLKKLQAFTSSIV
jgi:hypothetical protein